MKEQIYINKIKLNNKEFEYEITYKKIKNIYMRIKDSKIYISSPRRVLISDIEKFIIQKQDWILNTIEKQKNRIEVEKIKKYTDDEFIKLINSLVLEYSKKMNLYPKKITIKKLKYAWGSCTSNKNISFNRELIYFDEDVIRYVVVHEIAHLKYMNHQKGFWELVEKNIFNYKELRKRLKDRNR